MAAPGFDSVGESPTTKENLLDSGTVWNEISSGSRQELLPLSLESRLLRTERSGLTGGLSKLSEVMGGTLSAFPDAFKSRLAHDFSADAGSTATKMLESAALGLGSAALLARYPVFAKTALAGAGTLAGGYLSYQALNFAARAYSSSSEQERLLLAGSGSKSLAAFSADLIETSPAFIGGISAGTRLSKGIAPGRLPTGGLLESAEIKLRQKLPEGFHYIDLDAKGLKLPGAAEGRVDLLAAGKEMMKLSPWRGIEEGRFFKLRSTGAKSSTGQPERHVQMSARLPGKEHEVIMGRRSENLFHTHKESVLPTSSDFNSVFGTGIVAVPEKGLLTFYEGTGKEAQTIVRALKQGKVGEAASLGQALGSREFRSLVLDTEKELAASVALKWHPESNSLLPSSVKPLAFEEGIKNLSNWRGQLNIESLKPSTEALLKPGMTEFLRQIGGF